MRREPDSDTNSYSYSYSDPNTDSNAYADSNADSNAYAGARAECAKQSSGDGDIYDSGKSVVDG